MSKKFQPQQEEAQDSRFTKGMKFSSRIEYLNPKLLVPNPLNAALFADNNVDMAKLKEDIQKNGITNAIQVKKDKKTILAGHTRLKIALELGLASVPVQVSEFELSPEQEKEYIVKDNLLRRQLNNEQRMNLYRVLYPDVDKLLSEEKSNGRPKKGELSIKQIAEDTGQNTNTVKQQFKRARKEKGYSVPLLKDKKSANSKKEKGYSVPLSENNNGINDTPEFLKREVFNTLSEVSMRYSQLSLEHRLDIKNSLKKALQDLEKQEKAIV